MKQLFPTLALLLFCSLLSSFSLRYYKIVKIQFRTIAVLNSSPEHLNNVRVLQKKMLLHKPPYDRELIGINIKTGDTVWIPGPNETIDFYIDVLRDPDKAFHYNVSLLKR